MRIVVTGATGLIGRTLVTALLDRGDSVVVLSRSAASATEAFGSAVEVHEWSSPDADGPPRAAIVGADAVVHLMGEPVSQRWTNATRQSILSSRVLPTRNLVATLRALTDSERPKVLVSGSAVGYYGPHGDERVEESTPPGDDFLAGVVVAWENEALAAQDILRVVCTRTGVVLAAGGGALGTMLPIFKAGIGGPVGGGKQYVPWIHIDDEVAAIIAAVTDANLSGPVNLSAPEPVTNKVLSHTLGRVLHRPAFWPVPSVALKLLYGGMSVLVLKGQRSVPTKLTEAGFRFTHTDLEAALSDVLDKS